MTLLKSTGGIFETSTEFGKIGLNLRQNHKHKSLITEVNFTCMTRKLITQLKDRQFVADVENS